MNFNAIKKLFEKDTWYEEMTNDRKKSTVKGITIATKHFFKPLNRFEF